MVNAAGNATSLRIIWRRDVTSELSSFGLRLVDTMRFPVVESGGARHFLCPRTYLDCRKRPSSRVFAQRSPWNGSGTSGRGTHDPKLSSLE